jgi:flagellar motility protein MotE (MotC chaperone)
MKIAILYLIKVNKLCRIIMEKLSIKAYAVRHKLSIFNVVKMTKSGQLPTESIVENGKDVVYILIDDAVENKVKKSIVREGNKEPYSLRKENERLKKEIEKLKEEIAVLKNRV